MGSMTGVYMLNPYQGSETVLIVNRVFFGFLP